MIAAVANPKSIDLGVYPLGEDIPLLPSSTILLVQAQVLQPLPVLPVLPVLQVLPSPVQAQVLPVLQPLPVLQVPQPLPVLQVLPSPVLEVRLADCNQSM
jgi:hypothetical protein